MKIRLSYDEIGFIIDDVVFTYIILKDDLDVSPSFHDVWGGILELRDDLLEIFNGGHG